jgi:Tfp pilus assembly protein PilV
VHVSLEHLHEQDGFTLVEVMVAMVTGLVVVSALFAILEVSLHQTSRITDRVQATQLGDTMLTRITDPLNSACISREATPVQEGSGPTKLIFITGFSKKTTLEPGEVYKYTIEWKANGSNGEGKLTTLSQKATGGSWPTYTSWEAGSTTLLGEDVYEHKVVEAGVEHKYLFRYYKYGEATTSSANEGLNAMKLLTPSETTGLTSTEAKTAAGVEVAFTAAPTDNLTSAGTALGGGTRTAEFADQVTFAFATPSSEATIKDAPCE